MSNTNTLKPGQPIVMPRASDAQRAAYVAECERNRQKAIDRHLARGIAELARWARQKCEERTPR